MPLKLKRLLNLKKLSFKNYKKMKIGSSAFAIFTLLIHLNMSRCEQLKVVIREFDSLKSL